MQRAASTQIVNDIGQITLDQRYAGQQVSVQPVCDGIWHISTANSNSSNQEWFNDPEAGQRFGAALAWANQHPANAENTDVILAKLAAECK